MRALVLVSTLAVLLAMLDMPWSYYRLLRVVLCLTGVVGFVAARRAGLEPWMWFHGVAAVLYNPVLPVELGEKALWTVLNLVTVVGGWRSLAAFEGAERAERGDA